MPRVSIGLPVMNGEKYLAKAVESIRAQTYSDFELLISDNASDDRTQEIAERFAKKDRRITYKRHDENLGASANFNYVFHNTSGEFFRWAAHDDLIRPKYLETCVQALDLSPESVLAYPQTVRIDEEGKILGVHHAVTRYATSAAPAKRLAALLGPEPIEESLIHMCFPVFGLIRRSALQGTSLIANMPRSDMLLLVELALKGSLLPLDVELFLRREHAEGSVIAAERLAPESFTEREKLLAAWYDPRRGERFPATFTRLGIGYLRAALRTSMPVMEKLKTFNIVAGWFVRNGRNIAGEIKITLGEFLSGALKSG